MDIWHIVCSPPLLGGEGLNLQPNFQNGGGEGGLTGPQLLEWGCWDKGRVIKKKKFMSKNIFLCNN